MYVFNYIHHKRWNDKKSQRHTGQCRRTMPQNMICSRLWFRDWWRKKKGESRVAWPSKNDLRDLKYNDVKNFPFPENIIPIPQWNTILYTRGLAFGCICGTIVLAPAPRLSGVYAVFQKTGCTHICLVFKALCDLLREISDVRAYVFRSSVRHLWC